MSRESTAATGARKKRGCLRVLFTLAAAAALAGLLLVVFHKPILRGAAAVWIADESPVTKVDAVLIPGGGLETRPFAAAKLYHAGNTTRLVTFETEVFPSEELGITPPHHELILQVLEKLEVPPEAVLVIGDHVTSTQDEVEASRKWCDENGIKSLAVMTEIFPSRRVAFAYRNGFKGSDTTVQVVALAPIQYGVDDWWLHESGVISFQNEVIKYLYYRVRY